MSKDPRKKFGEHIRALRKEAGLSQEELADTAGLHRTYVGAIERGERNISLINIVHLARALHVKPADLLEGIS
jgi:transcriptional regulator with XRE-family HTH domain